MPTEQLKMHWLVQTAKPNVYPLVLDTVKKTIFPTLENDVTLRKKIEAMPNLGYGIEPHQVTALFWSSGL